MAKKKRKRSPLSRFLLLITVCVFVYFSSQVIYDTVIEYVYPKKYSEYVEQYAAEYEIDDYLLYSIIRTESSFDPQAVSSVGARGLTQITEDTFNWLLTKTGEDYTFDDLFTPEISIRYSAVFLSILQKEYGVTETVIAAYHAGMGNVSSWLEDSRYSRDGEHLITTPISDTNHYISKVTDAMDKYYEIYETEK